jgi:hypothetical protein
MKGAIALNDTNAKNWGGILIFAIRIVGAIVAAACFVAGLWSVFSDPGRGFSLMGLGIVVGIVFGRVSASAGKAIADGK